MKRLILSTLTAAILGASAAASADNLSIGFADPLSSLDPQLNNHAGDRSVALHFWDLLIENKWNKLQPGTAVSWKPLDSTTWEFKLREGVKWQDGTPFTADDLIYSLHPRPRRARQRGHLRRLPAHHRHDDRQGPADPDRQDQGAQPRPAAEPGVGARSQQARRREVHHRRLQLGQGHGRHRPYKFVSYTPATASSWNATTATGARRPPGTRSTTATSTTPPPAPPRCWPATWT